MLPRLTKLCLGGWANGELGAVVTFGWGVRPVHTIRKAFPSLGTVDYLEIGKLCLHDDLPRNSESWFLSRAIRMCCDYFPLLQVIWTWADGILGKPGYVYQATNFLYGGFIWTEIYLDRDGVKVHPRTVQGITCLPGEKGRGRRDAATTEALGLTKWWGKQFRYVLPVCGKRRWKELAAESPFDWALPYPKDADLCWEVQEGNTRRIAGPPPFIAGRYTKPGKQARLL